MKATEFVKKYDFDMAKHAVLNMPKGWSECYLKESNLEFVKSPPCVSDWVCMNDLKQIVDAFELVDRFGGYDSVLNMVNNPTCFGDSNFEIEIKLNESINLVEQCQND